MLKLFVVCINAIGVISILFALNKSFTIYHQDPRKRILILIPMLMIFLFGDVLFINYLFKPVVIDDIVSICSAVFFFGGVYSAVVMNLIAQSAERVESAEHTNRHDQLHHPLSDLPNRLSLQQRLKERIDDNAASTSPLSSAEHFALVTLFINNFDSTKEVLGHHKTEVLVSLYAARIRSFTHHSIACYQTQNNGFCLWVPATSLMHLATLVEDLQNFLELPILLEGLDLTLTSSVGAATYPSQSMEAEELLQYSELAAYQAQRTQRSLLHYTESFTTPFRTHAQMLCGLQHAIINEEFSLYFQPVQCVNQPELLCLEALLRWQIPSGDFISPAEFIPLAEQSNCIQSITRWVLESALTQLAHWHSLGLTVCLQINLSCKDLEDDKLLPYLSALLAQHAVSPSQLTLEITETSMMQNLSQAKKVLRALKLLGIKISIDDFGSGFSSLSILSELPIDEIKIDRSFVTRMLKKRSHRAIVSSTVYLAHKLKCNVVAEGVETEEVAKHLIALGCDKLQGYYINRPMPLAEVESWLLTQQTSAAASLANISEINLIPPKLSTN